MLIFDFSRATVTLSPRLPVLPSTLMRSFRNFSKSLHSMMLSSAGCWQSIVNFSVDFLPLTTPFFLRPLTAIVAWAGEECGGRKPLRLYPKWLEPKWLREREPPAQKVSAPRFRPPPSRNHGHQDRALRLHGVPRVPWPRPALHCQGWQDQLLHHLEGRVALPPEDQAGQAALDPGLAPHEQEGQGGRSGEEAHPQGGEVPEGHRRHVARRHQEEEVHEAGAAPGGQGGGRQGGEGALVRGPQEDRRQGQGCWQGCAQGQGQDAEERRRRWRRRVEEAEVPGLGVRHEARRRHS
mmetsp:Transcript_14614/g.38749  ORF Transcript_14614/g.38749 Transcript_14614/m.38749 type:complete len:294 (+) Transcript_14614:226-1107(+)